MDATFADRELDIMHVLWERGSATAGEVREALDTPLAYTTVQTILSILEDKRHVRHEVEGRAHRYYPVTGRRAAKRSAVRRLVQRLYDGSPRLLVTDLVRDRNLTEAELRELQKLLADRLGESGGT